MAVRGEFSPFSGPNCKLLIQLVREILNLSGESQRISEPSGCGNHVRFVQKGLGNILHIQY